jgi:hypothetical protein
MLLTLVRDEGLFVLGSDPRDAMFRGARRFGMAVPATSKTFVVKLGGSFMLSDGKPNLKVRLCAFPIAARDIFEILTFIHISKYREQ